MPFQPGIEIREDLAEVAIGLGITAQMLGGRTNLVWYRVTSMASCRMDFRLDFFKYSANFMDK